MPIQDTSPWDFCGADGVLRSVAEKPDTTAGFPSTWRIFGPLMPETVTFIDGGGEAGGVLCEPNISADIADLTAIPDRLTVGDQVFEGRDLKRRRDSLDFGALYKLTRKARGYNAYAMAEVTFEKPTEVTIGTGSEASLPGAAGKTGTSQGFRDAWFIGYRGDITAGIWFGNDEGTPMKQVAGGGLPAQVWRAFIVGIQP